MKRFFRRLPIVLCAASLVVSAAPPRAGAGGDAVSPIFGVAIPEGYRQWELVAPSHRTDKDSVRAILGNPAAMKAYRDGTLPFPDGAILAKPAWQHVRSGEFHEAFVPGAPQWVDFMVKDSKKYAATGGWGFGRFVEGKAADEGAHKSCFPCHLANVKGHDFVFTRYAP